MKTRSLVIPLVFAAVVLVVYFFVGMPGLSNVLSTGSGSPSMPADLAQKFDPLTIPYVDPVLNFSIRYPVGYLFEATDGQSAVFYAAGQQNASEVFFWKVVNGTLSADDLNQAAADLDGQFESQKTITVDGRSSLRMEYNVTADLVGEPAHLIEGYVPCGPYSLFLSATIPDSLSDDSALADYTLYSATCGS